jgi:hypothetical protein
MSGVISFINVGFVKNFLHVWLIAFGNAFIVAFPAVIIVVPFVRRIVRKLIRN